MRKGDWPIDQTVFLVKHYATMPTQELSASLSDYGIPRSVMSCHAKARYLGLSKKNAGKFTPQSGTKAAKNRHRSTPLRQAVIDILVRDKEATIKTMEKELGIRRSSLWRACDDLGRQGNLHIARYERSPCVTLNWEAVYRIGFGISATYPMKKEPQREAPYEVQPVPRPQLGAWGCVWNTAAQQTTENSVER